MGDGSLQTLHERLSCVTPIAWTGKILCIPYHLSNLLSSVLGYACKNSSARAQRPWLILCCYSLIPDGTDVAAADKCAAPVKHSWYRLALHLRGTEWARQSWGATNDMWALAGCALGDTAACTCNGNLGDSRYPPANLVLKHQQSSARPRLRRASRGHLLAKLVAHCRCEIPVSRQRPFLLLLLTLAATLLTAYLPRSNSTPPSAAFCRFPQCSALECIDDYSTSQASLQRGVSALVSLAKVFIWAMGVSYQLRALRA